MKRNIIPQKHTIRHYTINDTSESESITSTSENSNNSKNSDISYIPSTNDDTISYLLNKIQNNRRNKKNSKKYIQKK